MSRFDWDDFPDYLPVEPTEPRCDNCRDLNDAATYVEVDILLIKSRDGAFGFDVDRVELWCSECWGGAIRLGVRTINGQVTAGMDRPTKEKPMRVRLCE